MAFQVTSQQAQVFKGIAGIVTGIGQFLGSGEENEVAEFNSKIYQDRADAERESQKILEFQKRKIIKAQIGTQRAVSGASGFKFTGDPITIMQDSLANAEFDILIDRYNSEVIARGFENQSTLERFQGQQRAALQSARSADTFLSSAAELFTSQQTLGDKGTTLGGGVTSHGISVPSRFVPPR